MAEKGQLSKPMRERKQKRYVVPHLAAPKIGVNAKRKRPKFGAIGFEEKFPMRKSPRKSR
jgi:hypothetical protein